MDRLTEEFGDVVLDRSFTAQAKTPVHNHQGISRSLRLVYLASMGQSWGSVTIVGSILGVDIIQVEQVSNIRIIIL
jgi:hypothetical protein